MEITEFGGDDGDSDVPLLIDESISTRIIPVTLLTGFLGSGKTTLLNYILKARHGRRIAVIENEFSEGLGIEGMIARSGVDGASLGGFFELNNGCICCTVKDSLISTLEQLVLHSDRFDYVLIETTGLADPGPLISTFWMDEGQRQLGNAALQLDGVICVVDAHNILSYLSSEEISHDVKLQICYADRILLNKIDLVLPGQMDRVEEAVRGLNGLADIRRTCKSNLSTCSLPSHVDIASHDINDKSSNNTYDRTGSSSNGCDWVLNIRGYESEASSVTASLLNLNGLSVAASLSQSAMCVPCDSSSALSQMLPDFALAGAPGHHVASSTVLSTQSLIFCGTIDYVLLQRFLDSLLYRGSFGDAPIHLRDASDDHSTASSGSSEIYRMKGILRLNRCEEEDKEDEHEHEDEDEDKDEGKGEGDEGDEVREHSSMWVLQAVHEVFDLQPLRFSGQQPISSSSSSSSASSDSDISAVKAENRMVIIGKNIDLDMIREGLMRCIC